MSLKKSVDSCYEIGITLKEIRNKYRKIQHICYVKEFWDTYCTAAQFQKLHFQLSTLLLDFQATFAAKKEWVGCRINMLHQYLQH